MIVNILSWLKEMAERNFTAGDIGEGLSYYDRVLQLARHDDAEVADAHARIGEVLLAIGEIQQSKVHLLEALKIKPTQPHYLFLLSCLYASQANWEKACDFARKAHILVPNNSEYLRALGWAVLRSGDLAAGEKMLRQAVGLDPTGPGAVGDLSAALIEQRRFGDAVACLVRAAKEHPSDQRLAEMLAVAKKFRNQERDRTPVLPLKSPGPYGAVEELLRERMPEEGFRSEQIDSAIRLWRDYARGREFRFSRPGSWAAAIEYTISKLYKDARVTQKFVASKYSVSVSAVSNKSKELRSVLDLKEGDKRYCLPDDDIGPFVRERCPADHD
jgi:tetratricopeptide (TPR) repeat protein